jgi:hypothetical protein
VVSTTNTIAPIPLDSFAPNDSFDAAANLGTLGSRVENNLTIHAAGNDDYYRFVALSSFTATVNLSFQNALGDLGLAAYDAGRNLIAQVNTTLDDEALSFPVTAGLTYYIKAYGVNGAVTRNYGLSIVVNAPPTITSLSDSPDPQYAGGLLRLTANGVSDPDGNLADVRFYRESNNIPGLQTGGGGDTMLKTDSMSVDGFSFDFATSGLSAGTFTYYAVADDAGALISNVVTTTNTLVVDQPPQIFSLTDSPDPVLNGPTLTLTAGNVSDPDGNLSGVRFYRESNGIDFLQTDAGGDAFLGSDTDPSGGYTFDVPVSNLAPGYYLYYALAFDTAGVTSSFPAICLNRVHLPGDANFDDKVDFTDLVVAAQNYNGTGKTYAQGDFNFDTKVDSADLVLLAQNYNGVIIPPPPRAPVPLSAPVVSNAVSAPASSPATQSADRKAIFSTAPLARTKPLSTQRPRIARKHSV